MPLVSGAALHWGILSHNTTSKANMVWPGQWLTFHKQGRQIIQPQGICCKQWKLPTFYSILLTAPGHWLDIVKPSHTRKIPFPFIGCRIIKRIFGLSQRIQIKWGRKLFLKADIINRRIFRRENRARRGRTNETNKTKSTNALENVALIMTVYGSQYCWISDLTLIKYSTAVARRRGC